MPEKSQQSAAADREMKRREDGCRAGTRRLQHKVYLWSHYQEGDVAGPLTKPDKNTCKSI